MGLQSRFKKGQKSLSPVKIRKMAFEPAPHIAALYRYPVKGLSAEPLGSVRVAPGKGIPGDRGYAIENGPSGFDPAAPRFFQKAAFLMLMRNERLAGLATRFDDRTRVLTIARDGETLAEGNLDSEAGRRAIEGFFEGYMADELRGPPKILSAPGHSFDDCGAPLLSLINLSSLIDLEAHVGGPVHPLRFRGNLYVEGLPAWREFDLVGRRVRIGQVLLEATERINRCAATNVNPETAARDLAIPRTLLATYDHADCGIYLKVVEGGEIRAGDELTAA
jgi:uncharacterized protein YcbX